MHVLPGCRPEVVHMPYHYFALTHRWTRRHIAMQGRVSPAWETISATRHIFLMLANPLHSLTFTEVGSSTLVAQIEPAGSLLQSRAPLLPHAG